MISAGAGSDIEDVTPSRTIANEPASPADRRGCRHRYVSPCRDCDSSGNAKDSEERRRASLPAFSRPLTALAAAAAAAAAAATATDRTGERVEAPDRALLGANCRIQVGCRRGRDGVERPVPPHEKEDEPYVFEHKPSEGTRWRVPEFLEGGRPRSELVRSVGFRANPYPGLEKKFERTRPGLRRAGGRGGPARCGGARDRSGPVPARRPPRGGRGSP